MSLNEALQIANTIGIWLIVFMVFDIYWHWKP